jgi:hypothetical protein
MNNYTFNSVYAFKLSIDNLSGLIKSTISNAIPVKTQLGDPEKAALSQLIADNSKFQPMVKNPRKIELTDMLVMLNDERREIFSEIKRIIKLHLLGRDVRKRTAAQTLVVFFQSYWGIMNEPMNTITGTLNEMFAKYKVDDELKAAAVTAGFDLLLSEFESCNNDFNDIYIQRAAIEVAHELSASEQKSIVSKSYSQFCNVIEQAVNYAPNEDILSLFNNMNDLRKTYAVSIPSGKDEMKSEEVRETLSARKES